MNTKAMSVYGGLLAEIKLRTEAIDLVLSGKVVLRAKIAEETCYLQLRMICELIAIGCLVIHGDLSPMKSDLLKTNKASWIMTELAKLHPKFFPAPLELKDDTNFDPPGWVYKKAGFLTQGDLSKLWAKHAGDALHRGSARNILAKDRPPNFGAIKDWRDKIVSLLTRHVIPSPDEETICYFVMNDLKAGGNVGWNLFKRTDGDPRKLR